MFKSIIKEIRKEAKNAELERYRERYKREMKRISVLDEYDKDKQEGEIVHRYRRRRDEIAPLGGLPKSHAKARFPRVFAFLEYDVDKIATL
jgi:hypothetical protein